MANTVTNVTVGKPAATGGVWIAACWNSITNRRKDCTCNRI